MKIISPVEFKQAFHIVTEQAEEDLLGYWNAPTQYTAFMRSQVLPKVAQEIGLKAYSERDYYWLDAIFYEEIDTIHFGDNSNYAKYISVALEHENLPDGSIVEMNKLQLFNTPLKVLVTYAGGVKADSLLAKYARIMTAADVFSDFTTERKQLVIFGPAGNARPSKITWEFFTYSSGAFLEI